MHLWGNLQYSSSIFNKRKELKSVTLSSTLKKTKKRRPNETQSKLKKGNNKDQSRNQ